MKNPELIETLQNCAAYCNHCADASLSEDPILVACVQKAHACATVCTATASLLAMQYSDTRGMIEYCIKLCKSCTQECEKHDHSHCTKCAKACRACTDACISHLS